MSMICHSSHMTASHPSDGAEVEGDSRGRSDRPDTFAEMLAHDLRNPLTVARGRLSLVIDESESEHLDAVVQAHERMDAIIEDYLTLAREGSMVVDTEPVELASVVAQSWQYVATEEASLALRTERAIQADRNRVRQLLENLIRNAVEHGGSEVTVTVGDLEDGFFVADDGPGIPPAEREAVLDAGYSSVADKTGFGLSIVSRIVDAHDWALDVTDADGARFEITGVTFVS